MTTSMEALRERLGELEDLHNAAGLLEWDQQTMMPPRGAQVRSEATGTLARIGHEMFVSPETGRLIEAASAESGGAAGDSDEARLVKVAGRRWEKARRVPTELTAELARAGSIGHQVWITARAENDFKAFAPCLERNLELARRYVDCFDGYDCAYDVLLDDYEPGMKTAAVARLFGELKAELVPMIGQFGRLTIDADCLFGSFPVAKQRELVAWAVRLMGFDASGWRMDDAVHPFATSFGPDDVRITTRWDEGFYASALYGAMHECGHGLYEAGVAPELRRTPIGRVDSLALHESQSRLWENMVGRSRPFSSVLAARLGELFDGPLSALQPEQLYRAVNRVQPSFIRVEADEATYGLHVVLRFELEQELIEGRLAVTDLPEAWNARFEEYFGLKVPDDAHGVLQDVHWSGGMIGYFPTYALGNMIAGQLWAKVNAELPDLEAQIAAGELSPLREWLREHIHRHGSKFSTSELLERVIGGPIAVGPFVAYLKTKLSDVYGVAP